jgi:hypothetical protein
MWIYPGFLVHTFFFNIDYVGCSVHIYVYPSDSSSSSPVLNYQRAHLSVKQGITSRDNLQPAPKNAF